MPTVDCDDYSFTNKQIFISMKCSQSVLRTVQLDLVVFFVASVLKFVSIVGGKPVKLSRRKI